MFGITDEREGCAFLENLGFGELLLILVAALVIFGPSKLPEMGRSLGQAIREFKKATQSITEEVTKAATSDEASPARNTAAHVQPTSPPQESENNRDER